MAIQAVLQPHDDTRCGKEHVFAIVVFKQPGGAKISESSHQTRQATSGVRKSLNSGRTF